MSLKSGLASFFLLKFGSLSSSTSTSTAVRRCNFGHLRPVPPSKRAFTCLATSSPQTAEKSDGELLVVVGGGAAGVYGAIRAKSLAPHLNVLVVEKGKLLSKVKISGGGRCNVTNGHCPDTKILAEHYPRGHRELKGSFFNTHGPGDTMSWFTDHGVALKIEEDGRVFPITNNSSSIVDCLLSEARERGVPVSVCLQTGKTVTSVSAGVQGKFILKVEKRSVEFLEYLEADYLLIASGGSRQGYDLAVQLGHSIVDGVPSLFTFKIKDPLLSELSGVTFLKVEASLILESDKKNIPHLTQACISISRPNAGYTLGTQWSCNSSTVCMGGSGSVQSRLQRCRCLDVALLMVDVVPDLNIEDMKAILSQQKQKFSGLNCDTLWASVSNNSINSVAYLLKHCTFEVVGKGQYKDEFVTAGGVPLSEVLNVDGVTGGFNFQNAWSGGYIAGTTIGELAAKAVC
ncbi:unnamed protein product [Linum tenue]|uniref:RsdA/BaiN/AoA(So)-like Rossmann fold-like domain-containing protein n=1 Tax=Linum tenue TaxID=586396 RepID=A0AAV0N4U7_9ROSI|nr:unnamed protein product [Linum tenue]